MKINDNLDNFIYIYFISTWRSPDGKLFSVNCSNQAIDLEKDDTDPTVFSITTQPPGAPDEWARAAKQCSMPSLFIPELCHEDALDDVKKNIKNRMDEYNKIQMNAVGSCEHKMGSEYNTVMETAYSKKTEGANEVSFIFQKDLPEFKNSAGRIWIRQIPRVLSVYPEDTNNYHYARMKVGLKSIFLPYPITDLLDTTKPGYYFDCFGIRLNE